ncbi:hypothetical protein Sjap_010876 [Stephania japonica]|uniref:Protein POLAR LOCALIZATION DURING ASYMMETRIC DIVISION AND REDISTRIBUTION-like n=1 Tax=Stephania japonica TaxID=461633 RepID=A0AAP0P4Z2_9MAGN
MQRKQMRISDFLNEEEIEESEDRPRRFSVFSRWVSKQSRRRRSISSLWLGSPRAQKCEWKNRCHDCGGLNEKSSLNPDSSSSGRQTNDGSFNLGLGAGLCFLIAATKNEFDKIIELQKQMEILIKDINEMSRNDENSTSFVPNEDVGSSAISLDIKNMNSHPVIHSCTMSHNLVEANETKCDRPTIEDCSLGIDQLEMELEAELEYLQSRLDSEDPEHPQQQKEKLQVIAESTASNESCKNLDNVDNHQDADYWENCGVSPDELQRRLHELLEERQQEQIEELELALESTKQKLYLKEMEVSWWKDIAEMISQHVPYPIHLPR